MKKRGSILILAGMLAFSVCGCGSDVAGLSAQATDTETESVKSGELLGERLEEEAASESQDAESETDDVREEAASDETDNARGEAAEDFSFADLATIEFRFASGAGGWSTLLTVDADGSFYGEYYDGEMGSTGADYPYGTMYRCDFAGQFTEPVKVNEYTYSVRIGELTYEKEAGTEEIIDGVRYCYSDVYGLDGAEEILIYLPGAPLAELPEEFLSWVGYYDLSNTEETELPFYALNNEAQQYGFSSSSVVDELEEYMVYVQLEEDFLENSIQNDSLTQQEYNEKTYDLYVLWDSALNYVWDVLKQTQDADVMDALTQEERAWIAAKEQAVAGAGAEYEGGSMQAMLQNQKAAELTKERTIELLELLGIELSEL